jgi:hypothetical protein
MSSLSEAAQKFIKLVESDLELRKEFEAAPDLDTYRDLAIRRSAERGLNLDPSDFEAPVQEDGEISDAGLEAVAGGAMCGTGTWWSYITCSARTCGCGGW